MYLNELKFLKSVHEISAKVNVEGIDDGHPDGDEVTDVSRCQGRAMNEDRRGDLEVGSPVPGRGARI